jgi:glutathione synthase/RimK-type ligase-like ATP-grasp enzyme
MREWLYIQDYLATVLKDVYCINPRVEASRTDNKLFQLACAELHGFKTPRTLISNNPDAVRDFVRSMNGNRVVFKTLAPYASPTGRTTYTTIVDEDKVEQFKDSLRLCPGVFQEFIAKQYELRVTVVESEVFAAQIDSNSALEVAVDWRRSSSDDIYKEHTLSDAFRAQLLRLHADLGLVYGAYDFIVDSDGTPVFLEVNPSGQWYWLEQRLGFPISESIARALQLPTNSF